MRFQAPRRDQVSAARFDHPIYADFSPWRSWLEGPDWPGLDELNAELDGRRHRSSGVPLAFVEQTPALLADGLHYEARIHAQGAIATRPQNWHDLFNALVWLERSTLKCAVNTAYVREFARAGVAPRTRAQSALTHFDEAGALVLLHDPALLAAWDRHDWQALFRGCGFHAGAKLHVFGHALLEHCLLENPLPVAKCLVATMPRDMPGGASVDGLIESVAGAIATGHLLADPVELRPLPLAGLEGWHPGGGAPGFFRDTPCFRPLRPGRRYPAAWNPPVPDLQSNGGLRRSVAAL